MRVVLVGDIHSKVTELLAIAAKHAPTPVIQLGDFGFGFTVVPELPDNLMYIRGNHDDPALAANRPNYLGDYGTLYPAPFTLPFDKKVFYISGAYSIDYALRVPNVSWWEQEELSYPELAQAINLYERERPDIVISHEAPSAAIETILNLFKMQRHNKLGCAFSRTAHALQQMLDIHKPEMWVFGHHHLPGDFNLFGTRFVCLPELTTMEVSI